MPPVPNVEVGVAMWVEDNDHVLMVERAGADGAGTWCLPGGWLEFGELPEHAAVRETKEETGVVVTATSRLGYSTVYSDDGARWITTLFVKGRLDGDPTPQITEPDKCPRVEWVPKRAVRDKPLFAPVRDMLSRHPWMVL